MEPPSDKEEVTKAAAKLKNNKIFRKDSIYAVLLKYAPRQSSSVLKDVVHTEEYPIEIKSGILTPLAKTPKKDVNINGIPTVLLSLIVKILF